MTEISPKRPWDASYPPGVRWDVPIAAGTVPALLDRMVAAYSDRPAIECQGEVITYTELGRRADRFAAGLLAAGLQPGDPVALLLPNTPYHPIAFFGILRAGGRVVHLTPLDPLRALARKLADSGARIVVSTEPLVVGAAALGARLIVGQATTLPPGAAMLDDVSADSLASWPVINPSDIAVLQYTGGTTGLPRAAMLTHANLTAAVSIYDAWLGGQGDGTGPGDRVLCVLPLFHIYALTCLLLRGLSSGAELLLRPRFDAAQVLEDIEHRRVTHIYGVPTMWIALLAQPGIEARDFSSVRSISSGGAALPHEVQERFAQVTGQLVGGGWGMTETSPAGTMIAPGRAAGPGEIGVPLPGIDMRVVALDDARHALPPGETGEVCVRGPNVTAGYWNRPEENAAAFVDGWFLTGDVGHMSEDGVFTLVDRKKDMIISGGFNVYPRAIEEAIFEHPGVKEAAVIGVPDAYRGQAARAYVVMQPDAEPLTIEALRTFLSDKLGRHELPTQLELRAALPHTAVGKLSKRDLMDEAACTPKHEET